MATRELLIEWHQKASLNFASRFLLKARIEQGKLDFIRDTFLTSFSPRYFQIHPAREISSSKINWVKSLLLVPDRYSAVMALYEIALQIRYSKSFPVLWEEFLRLRKNPINLRSFLFELFVYKTFDSSMINTVKKPVMGQQELEGYCTLNGKEFLFECKLPYIPGLDELFDVQRLMLDFFKQGSNKVPLNGYIAAVFFQRPFKDAHRKELGQKISNFYKGLPHGVDVEIDYVDPGKTGRLEVKTYTKKRLDEMKRQDKADVLFYLTPTGEINNNGAVKMEGKLVGRFNILRDEVYEKLEDILKKEKKQHPPEVFPRKILFIGSESFPEFQFGLFQIDNMFDLNRVVELCNKLKLECIVCFVRKYYQDDHPFIKVDVIAPPELMAEAQLIKHIFYSFNNGGSI